MTWDVLHKADLKLEHGLTTAQVREALLRGNLRDEDMIRPAGSDRSWSRLTDWPALIRDLEPGEPPIQRLTPAPDDLAAPVAPMTELVEDKSEDEEYDPLDEDEEAAEFTLARSATPHVEELDLAAMVDVAFQMVLFFLVTAATVLYKTLEIPSPNPDNQKNAATQGRRSVEDLMRDYILVEIDPSGVIQVDRRPVAAEELIDRLRQVREETARSAMLLQADYDTQHKNAVLAYDAANEIGLRIAIARPPKPVAGEMRGEALSAP
jgi:biopolymer transport protein ExbD